MLHLFRRYFMNKNDHPWFELEVHPSGHSVTSSWKIGLALFCIILIALAFRWYFFIGFVCADPQDDGIYVSIIRSMVNGTYSLTRIRDVILGNRLNPADNFQLRMGFLVPVRLLVEFFGPSQLSFTLYPILCSIGGILLTYFFINQLAGNKLLGLIAAYLLAIYPIDCVFSTKISPETPLGFFIALTIFFFVRGELQLENGRYNVKTIVSFLLCGAFFSIANSIKTLGIVLPVFFFSYFLLYRKLRWQYLFIIIGFLPVFVVISYYYYINSGDPFLQNTVNAQSQLINYSDPKCINQMQLGPLEVLYTFGEPLDHTRWAFAFKSYVFDVIFYLTIYYYLFLIGAISWLSYYRKHFTNENNRVMSILLIWVISAFLFLEFAPVSLTEVLFNSKYYMLPKAPRFHNYMSLPVVSFGAIIFYSLRYRKKIMIAGLLLVLVISLVSMHQIKSYYLDGIREMKEVASFIKEHPERIYYTDHLARGELEYFLQLNPNIKIKNINSLRNINGLGSGILILGGARSVDLAGELPMKLIPEWAK
jgi:4-amino-4-deoxy-L-arabinose transferase-like glycosyltransferase